MLFEKWVATIYVVSVMLEDQGRGEVGFEIFSFISKKNNRGSQGKLHKFNRCFTSYKHKNFPFLHSGASARDKLK